MAELLTRRAAVALIIASTLLVASGCAERSAVTNAPSEDQSNSPNSSARGVLSAKEASESVALLRFAVVNGQKSSNAWLRPQPDGSFLATGYLSLNSGPWPDSSGSRSLFGLEVPEQVGGLTLYHLVPLVGDDSTSATADGRLLELDKVFGLQKGELFEREMCRLTARFSVQNGWVHADSLTFTSKEASAVPIGGYDYPTVGLSASKMAQDATLPAGPSPWLDVSNAPGVPAFMLTGWSNDLQTNGDAALVGVNVPDRLGPAAIYHVAQVAYSRPSEVPTALAQREPNAKDYVEFRYPVRLQSNRLIAVKK